MIEKNNIITNNLNNEKKENKNLNNDYLNKKIICPDCGAKLVPDSGCMCCKICGFSLCSVS